MDLSTRPLAPLAVAPLERPLIWGGDALAARYGKPALGGDAIGESWECWDANRVAGGPFDGASIAELRASLGPALMGGADAGRIFPLLTKFIDARQALSVQVHPNDAYARAVEHQHNGKTECWYVLEAEPDASIVLGWNRQMSREEYERRVADGTLGETLRYVPARAGDVFHIPAGTTHAIGKGIVLFETQQASDLTYRIYDYDRPGPDGKLRELHVRKAGDVLIWEPSSAGALAHVSYALGGLGRTLLIADPNFWVERIRATATPCGIDLEGMPLTVTALAEPLELEARGATVELAPYATAIVPAGLDVVMVSAPAGEATFLAAAPPARPDAVAKRLGRAGVGVAAATDFLAQF